MFYFLMQRVHLLIFSIILLSLFLSLIVIIDRYSEQSEIANKCLNLASLAEQIYASPDNTSVVYDTKINGTLSAGNYTLSINSSKNCSISLNVVLLEKEVTFNNTITITKSGDVVDVSG